MRVARPALVGVLATAVALSGLAACSSDDGRLAAGESRDYSGSVDGQQLEVRVPSGTITLTIGAPEETIATGSSEVTAPDSGALVPVSWSINRRVEAPVTGFDQEATLTLVTIGGEAQLATIADDSPNLTGGQIVAVDGSGEPSSVSVAYDGVEQQVSLDGSRESGPADALYDSADTQTADCSKGWRLDPTARLEVECRARTWTLPYLPDAGWAADGSVHVIVEPDVTLWKATVQGDQYRARFVSATDAADTSYDHGNSGAASFEGLIVSESVVLPYEWQVDATYQLRSRGPRGSLDGREVTLSGGGVVEPSAG